jgi:hypothetical protein
MPHTLQFRPRPSLALGQGGRNLQPAQSPDKIDVEGRAQGVARKTNPMNLASGFGRATRR